MPSAVPESLTRADVESRWQATYTAQDELVVSILRDRLTLHDDLARRQQAYSDALAATARIDDEDEEVDEQAQREVDGEKDTMRGVEEKRDAVVRRLEGELTALKAARRVLLLQPREYNDLISTSDDRHRRQELLDAQLAEIAERKVQGPGAVAQRSGRGGGRAQAVVLIDGNYAPFADDLIQTGVEGGKRASSELRAAVAAEMAKDNPGLVDIEISVFLWHYQFEVSRQLQRQNVISAISTFTRFLDGFIRENTSNFIFDLDRNPVAPHLASLLKLYGLHAPVHKVFLAGCHPTVARQGMSDLEGPKSMSALEEMLDQGVWPKVVVLNHHPDPAHLSALGTHGPILSLPHLFRSTIARPIVQMQAQGQGAQAKALPAPPTGMAAQGGWKAVEGLRGGGGGAGGGGEGGGGGNKGRGKGKERESEWEKDSQVRSLLKINPSRGMVQQEPRLCFHHYVNPVGCTKARGRCKDSHDYELTAGQLRRLKEDVAEYPCPSMRKAGQCAYSEEYGELCMFSHDPKILARASKW
ncbi:hypothetical protein JCM10207_007393 [Rhodosporidiobolus poonsookiae]